MTGEARAETREEPLDAAAALAWMRDNGARLRALVDEETGPGGDRAPAGDPAVRASLRFAAEAMAAVAAPGLRPGLRALCEGLPAWLEEARDLHDEHMARGAGAIALEQHLQFRARPGEDPSLDVALRRRVRIGGWVRVVLLGLEERLGPAADGLAGAVLDAMRGASPGPGPPHRLARPPGHVGGAPVGGRPGLRSRHPRRHRAGRRRPGACAPDGRVGRRGAGRPGLRHAAARRPHPASGSQRERAPVVVQGLGHPAAHVVVA